MPETKDDIDIRRKIKLLKKHAAELAKMIPSDDGIADAVGLTREIEVALQATRQKWEEIARVEMEPIRNHDSSRRQNEHFDKGAPVAIGKEYELVPQFKTVRTYNTPAILAALAGDQGSILAALQEALSWDAVRMNWRYTELKALLNEAQTPMVTIGGAVTDEDGTDAPLMGENRIPNGMKRALVKQT